MKIHKIIFILLTSINTLMSDDNSSINTYHWNRVESEWIDSLLIFGVILDYSGFSQDQNSTNHVGNLKQYSRGDIRGIRVGSVGTINWNKPWRYTASFALGAWDNGFNIDNSQQLIWFDLSLAIPLWGDNAYVEFGKMKEPISQERIMALNHEQIMERPTHLDALLPSRNIGITLGDVIFDNSMTYKVGIFNDALEQDSSFKDFSTQYITRITALAYEDVSNESLLHLGIGYRYSDAKVGYVRYRTSPEQYFLPDWVDTGKVNAQNTKTTNLEISYVNGPVWLASEYTNVDVTSNEHNNPNFNGYHVALTYALTGEHRGYNKKKGVVKQLVAKSDFTKGGTGAIDLAFRYSYLDLTSEDIVGGKLGIHTAGVGWYMSSEVKLQMQWVVCS